MSCQNSWRPKSPPEIPRFSSPPTMEFWMVPAAAGPPAGSGKLAERTRILMGFPWLIMVNDSMMVNDG